MLFYRYKLLSIAGGTEVPTLEAEANLELWLLQESESLSMQVSGVAYHLLQESEFLNKPWLLQASQSLNIQVYR